MAKRRTTDQYFGDEPCGDAGSLARRMRDQEYVLGWDRIADKRGWVHST